MLPSSLVNHPQQQSRKQKNAKSFTGEIGQRQDVTKTSASCPSKSDDEMLSTRFGISS